MTTRQQPDPAQGIFETMLVVRGEPVARQAHLSRLEASLEAVYGVGLPAQTRQLVAKHAEGLELGRVRLTFVPDADVEVERGEIDRSLHFPEDPVSLSSHRVDGGLGCHKWADRSALPSSSQSKAAILVDGDEALEADRANVFAVRKGALFTPPLDGRILPGVTRATVHELAKAEGIEASERTLTLAELRESEEVFLTNSIRGIEAVGSVDGTPLSSDRPVTELLSNALQEKWETKAAARRRPLRASV
ncbi:MAG TPA: aminotransferase class IV [Solirubrobacterales bacterium]|nr:aminotransferase class IV [Solirubrobacterales bacterium]